MILRTDDSTVDKARYKRLVRVKYKTDGDEKFNRMTAVVSFLETKQV